MDEERARDEILQATLSNVVFDGWTDLALRAGATAAGYDRAAAMRFFPGGVSEVVDYFAEWADRRMEEDLAHRDLVLLPMADRVALAVRTRVERLQPYKEAVRHTVAYLALPQNLPLGTRLLFRTVDRLWYAVGDASTDFTYYTKRASLAGLLVATTLYWIDDRSEDAADTWAFLDRRLAGSLRAGRTGSGLGRIGDLMSRLPSPRRFARKVRRQVETL